MNNKSKTVKVILITQGISRVTMPILAQKDIEVKGIVESEPRGYGAGSLISLRVVAKHILKFVMPSKSLERLAREQQLPYFFLQKTNKDDFAKWLKRLQVDLIVIYSMSQLLPQEILDIPPLGVLNLHPSLLPAYRGPNPWFWMYYDGVKQGGVTLHYVDAGEDTGDIIYQRTYAIPLGMKSPAMQDLAIGTLGVEIIIEALKELSRGHILPRQKQPKSTTTIRARNIKQEEHRTVIDWANWPIERIWHLMRGTELWLNCIEEPSGICAGHRWVVDNFEKSSSLVQGELLGQVQNDFKGFYVQCRDGKIRIYVHFSWRCVLQALVRKLLK